MEHANAADPSDFPPIRREELPHGSNYRFRPLTTDENHLLNMLLTRGAIDELTDAFDRGNRTDLANLASSVQRQQDDLYRFLQIRSSINILRNNLEQTCDYLHDAISILIRSRNDDFRILINGGTLDFLPGLQALSSSTTPIGLFRPSVYCQHCTRVGHFPVECPSYLCPTCRQTAPGHTTSQCPARTGDDNPPGSDGSLQAPLPIRPPVMVPTQPLTRPLSSSSEEAPYRRRPPPGESANTRDSPPALSRLSSSSSLSEQLQGEGPSLSISEAVQHVHHLSSLATATWNNRSHRSSISSGGYSPIQDSMEG